MNKGDVLFRFRVYSRCYTGAAFGLSIESDLGVEF